MFKRLEASGVAPSMVRLSLDGRDILAASDDSVAAALLAAGLRRFRTPPTGSDPRAPHCMMGVCFDCLVEIDGVANQQACLVPVRDGMTVRQTVGARELP